MLMDKIYRRVHRFLNRFFGGKPAQVNPCHMNNPLIGQSSRLGEYGMAQRDRPMFGQFFKWTGSTTFFYRARYTLRQQQPPRNNIAIPCVDDDVHVLIEQITFYNKRHHGQQYSAAMVPGKAWRCVGGQVLMVCAQGKQSASGFGEAAFAGFAIDLAEDGTVDGSGRRFAAR